MCVCMSVTDLYVCTFSYYEIRLVLIAPLYCWCNSTLFLCRASLCTIKIDNLRAYHIAPAYSTLVVLVLNRTLRPIVFIKDNYLIPCHLLLRKPLLLLNLGGHLFWDTLYFPTFSRHERKEVILDICKITGIFLKMAIFRF